MSCSPPETTPLWTLRVTRATTPEFFGLRPGVGLSWEHLVFSQLSSKRLPGRPYQSAARSFASTLASSMASSSLTPSSSGPDRSWSLSSSAWPTEVFQQPAEQLSSFLCFSGVDPTPLVRLVSSCYNPANMVQFRCSLDVPWILPRILEDATFLSHYI